VFTSISGLSFLLSMLIELSMCWKRICCQFAKCRCKSSRFDVGRVFHQVLCLDHDGEQALPGPSVALDGRHHALRLQVLQTQKLEMVSVAPIAPISKPGSEETCVKVCHPARMCATVYICSFELLRHRLPASLEHMLTFIYLAYSMMALLYETVPTIIASIDVAV
jgi:hypothetical protein